ncbi:UNVERIFIED_CONTAM: putative mitochondrial protein [Sesamum radiatum]|uniref:Mitochondrial protein n=1 Tax=Sesamum radiatum TaxID=300843 RepID=A0AAW2RVY9_SESRA
MQSQPTPNSLSKLRAFSGLSGFYRRFVKDHATKAGPLTDLLKPGPFCRTHSAARSVKGLKQKESMISLPIFALPYFSDAKGVQKNIVLK